MPAQPVHLSDPRLDKALWIDAIQYPSERACDRKILTV